MKIEKRTNISSLRMAGIAAALSALSLAASSSEALAQQSKRANGTTLAGYKTLDICQVDDSTWRYSGVIAVWNEGAIDTIRFTINDFIEYNTGTGQKWIKGLNVFSDYKPGEIPAGTTKVRATTFPYSIDAAPLPGDIRNNASLTILNHSGSLGKPFGPNPKATYAGPIPPPPCEPTLCNCAYTQGYWGDKPGVVWPIGYDKNADFFLSGQTWQQVLKEPPKGSGYYILAHQYITAVLNVANGACVPQGVYDTLNLAGTWLMGNAPIVCTGPGSCGLQKTWEGVLVKYNEGVYPEGPLHCEDE